MLTEKRYMVHRDVKSERDLVHVGDVVELDLSVSKLVAAVGAEDGQLFFVILCSCCTTVVLAGMARWRLFIKRKHQDRPP